tara:strand:+ start:10487 stop:10777 length:291 start_codon:yes stop_codon:yes gene_type:complete
MKRTGGATRTIDKAVQLLFKYGFIYIQTKSNEEKYFGSRGEIYKEEYYIKDPQADERENNFNTIQENLKNRILKRLHIEHQHLDLKVTKKKILIKK